VKALLKEGLSPYAVIAAYVFRNPLTLLSVTRITAPGSSSDDNKRS